MPISISVDLKKLQEFVKKASAQTYASGKAPVSRPERPDFIEYTFEEGDFSYRDSYTGYTRSRGMEIVRQNGKPIWANLYGGGMVEGKEDFAEHAFSFLKKALGAGDKDSFRGPKEFTFGEWRYSYQQDGDIQEFSGKEKIYYQGELVFFHRNLGGIIA